MKLHISTLEDPTPKYIYTLIKSNDIIQGNSSPIIATMFTPGGKDINEGVELPCAQWIMSKPKNEIITHLI